MLGGIFAAIATFIILIALGWLGQEITNRLPDQSTKHLIPLFDGKRIAVHADLDSFWLEEFNVHYVDEWEIGHQFGLVAIGEAYISKNGTSGESDEFKARLFLTFQPSPKSYAGTDQIGWCKITDREDGEKYVEGRLLLSGHTITTILQEFRLCKKQRISIWAFENEKGGLVVNGFSFNPTN